MPQISKTHVLIIIQLKICFSPEISFGFEDLCRSVLLKMVGYFKNISFLLISNIVLLHLDCFTLSLSNLLRFNYDTLKYCLMSQRFMCT